MFSPEGYMFSLRARTSYTKDSVGFPCTGELIPWGYKPLGGMSNSDSIMVYNLWSAEWRVPYLSLRSV